MDFTAFPEIHTMGASRAPDSSSSPTGSYTLSLPFRRLVISTDLPFSALGNFAATTIRGGLGYALRRVACKRPGMECAGCGDAKACVFTRCYGQQQTPEVRPYTLMAQEHDGMLCIVLTLLADAVEDVGVFLRAFELFGERGIGKEIRRFGVREVYGINERGTVEIGPGEPAYGEIDRKSVV
jgi:hypothetical protein